MKKTNYSYIAAILIAGALLAAKQTRAQIIISEVDPNGSSSSTSYNADWFELENLGTSAVDITGWKIDDSSDAFSSAVALTGVTSIAAGQTVVFIENTGLSAGQTTTLDAAFASAWFGSNVPSTLTLANYGGSGVGLSSSGDAVNIFDSTGDAVTGVTFGATTLAATLDNSAGLSGAISQPSVAGVNGAFSDGTETGSPGNITATPEPSTVALAGAGVAGLLALRRNRKA